LCVDHLPYHPLSPFIYAFVLIAALLGVWWVLRSRTVHRSDVEARGGAANVDSACTGTNLGDFLRATDLEQLPADLIASYS